MSGPTEKPLLEFPCEFPIKAMGLARNDFELLITDLVRQHAPDLTQADVSSRPSKEGKYISITLTVTATSREQLDAIYYALTDCEHVLMSL